MSVEAVTQQAVPSQVEVKHGLSLLGGGALAKRCDKQEIVITCKPQLVGCDPVVVVPDCKEVSIVIK